MTFGRPVTAGSLLVGAVRIGSGGSCTLTSTGGRTWTQDKHQGPQVGWTFEVHSLADAPSGSTTVTANCTGGGDSLEGTSGYSGMWYRILSSTASNIAAAATIENDIWVCGEIAFK